MRPNQRACRPRRLAQEEFARGNIWRIPNLFRNQARSRGHRKLHHPQKLFGRRSPSRRQFVMGAFPRQKRPCPASSGAIKRRSILMLAIAIAVVAIPARSLRQFHAQKRVNDFHGVADPGVVRGAQPEANQSERIRTDDVGGRLQILPQRPVLDGHKAVDWRGRIVGFRRSNANVVALHSELPSQFAARRVSPALHVVIPVVGGLPQHGGNRLLAHQVRQFSRRQEPRDFDRQGEGRKPRVFFPAVLLRDRTVAHQKSSRLSYQIPPALQPSQILRRLASQQIHEQDGEGRLIHLQTIPVGTAVQPHVLRPVSVGILRSLQIAKHPKSVGVRTRRQEANGRFHQITWPDQVISAQVFVPLVEAPGNRKAGNHAAQKILRLMHPQHGRAGAIKIVLPFRLIELEQAILPVPPVRDIVLPEFLVGLEQTRTYLLSGLGPDLPETESQDELSPTSLEVNLSGERDVPVLRPGVVPGHLVMLRQILPPVRVSDEAHRDLLPGRRTA